MIERYKVEEFLYTNCTKTKRSGDGYVLRCPVCGDSKKNPNMRRCHVDYYLKYDEWIYKCYNGDCPESSGNIQSLYAHVMGVTWKEANDELIEKKYDSAKIKAKLDRDKNTFVDEEDEKGVLDLDFNDCISLTDKPDGRVQQRYHHYLKRFLVDRWIPTRRNVMVAYTGKYKNRFIIPVYENGEMVYFQGRAMNNDIQPKFLNPVVVKENIILNRESFDPDKFIIVSEGLVDAFMIEDDQGTTCLGASISDAFLENILPLSRKGVIVALDNPVIDESGYTNYKKIVENCKHAGRLRYFFMPGTKHKDLNDYKLKNRQVNMYDFVVNNSITFFKTSIIMKNVV